MSGIRNEVLCRLQLACCLRRVGTDHISRDDSSELCNNSAWNVRLAPVGVDRWNLEVDVFDVAAVRDWCQFDDCVQGHVNVR